MFSETIHEINGAGEIERSFSAPYLEGSNWSDWIVAVNLLSARITCTSEAIWVAYHGLGEVHALEPDGTVRWIVRIEDLDHPGFLQQFRADGNWAFGMNLVAGEDQAIESVHDVALLDDDVLAVSVTLAHGSNPRTASHGVVWLNPRDGSSLGAFVAEHRVLAGARGTAVLYRSRPFPQVAVVDTRGP